MPARPDSAECETLIALPRRRHENLPAVEVATERYVAARFRKGAAAGGERRMNASPF